MLPPLLLHCLYYYIIESNFGSTAARMRWRDASESSNLNWNSVLEVFGGGEVDLVLDANRTGPT